jgi:hypothetical protein
MAHTSEARAWRWLLLGTLLLGLGLGVGTSVLAWPFMVDDAFIVARYARRLATGQGYTFQAGPATDGVTGPLWLLPLVAAARLGIDPALAAKLGGLLAALLAFTLACHRALVSQGGKVRAMWLALLLGTAGPFWLWAVGGLETGLTSALCTVLALATMRRPQPLGAIAGSAAACLAWLRPELAPWVGLQLLVVMLRARREGRLAIALGIAGALGVLAFRWLQFGHLLPLSAHAKPASIANGAGYLLETLRAPTTLALLPWLVLAAWRGPRAVRLVVLGLLVHALALLLAGGDWMQGARLFVPLMPLACWAAADAIVRLGRRHARAACLLGCASIMLSASASSGEALAARAAGELRERRLPLLLEALAPYPDPIVALDIGAIGYFSEHSFIDLGGLIEPRIAYSPGGHLAKRIDARWLEREAPSALLLHSRLPPKLDAERRLRWFAGYAVERSVLSQRWVLLNFRVTRVVPYAEDYFYVVLARD